MLGGMSSSSQGTTTPELRPRSTGVVVAAFAVLGLAALRVGAAGGALRGEHGSPPGERRTWFTSRCQAPEVNGSLDAQPGTIRDAAGVFTSRAWHAEVNGIRRPPLRGVRGFTSRCQAVR